jgi:hypothetical protein
MKSGLLLTLKELIKLGVIKIKKKRRRRGLSTIKKIIQEQQPSLGQDKYNAFVTTSAPNPQAYSDALRLRDESRNFDTRLLEYKNQQQEQKLLLEDQQQQQQQLQQRQQQIQNVITQGIPIINNLALRLRSGFTDDDNVDVTETFGSDNFKTQQDIADPELRQMPSPQMSDKPSTFRSGPSAQDMYEDIMESITQETDKPSSLVSQKQKGPPLALPAPKRGRGRPRKIKT